MKKFIKMFNIKNPNNKIYLKTNLNKLFLLIPLFLLSFSLFITCIRLIQKETIVSSAFKNNTKITPANHSQNNIISVQKQEKEITDNFITADNNNMTDNNIEKLQSRLAGNIIRLHVIANSDSDSDQSLKYMVRNSIIEKLRSSLSDVKNMEDAENIINRQLTEIEQTALDTINENGSCYSVNATICNRNFPVKTYGDLTFPAGEYRALCIEIGEAKGKNWWCVLFPSLCFVNDTTAVVPSESKEKLRTELGEKDYLELEQYSKTMKDTATSSKDREKPTLEVHSALYDWIRSKFQ